MDTDLKRRLGANETIFRDVNEGIERGQWPGEPGDPVSFRCECARLGCNLLLELTLAEYEAVRSHPRRFLVIDGHEVPEVEKVVERHSGYIVVEKVGPAGQEASEQDPRG